MLPISLVLLPLGCGPPGDAASDSSATPNTAPLADAGADATVPAGASVRLSGAGSTDPDGDPLVYSWSFDAVPADSALDATAFSPNEEGSAVETGFEPDGPGTYVVSLSVFDGDLWSAPDRVVIGVEGDDPALADAGSDIVVEGPQVVCLDGSGSQDPEGAPVLFNWTLLEAPSASSLTQEGLERADGADPCFLADVEGIFLFSLVVDRGGTWSLPDYVTVTVGGEVGEPESVELLVQDCTWSTLDAVELFDVDEATAEEPVWAIQTRPADSTATDATSLVHANSLRTDFHPDVAGEYVIAFVVSGLPPWLMTVTAEERASNEAPEVSLSALDVDEAFACCVDDGASYVCDTCAEITVGLGVALAATDADGDPLTVFWEVTAGSASLDDPSSPDAVATLPGGEPTEPATCEEDEHTFRVTVTDCPGESVVAIVTSTARWCGLDPSDAECASR